MEVGMKTGFMTIAAAAVAALLHLAMPSTAMAVESEDCGTQCASCFGGYEGTGFKLRGAYNMTCFFAVPYCVACAPARANDGVRSEALLAVLKSGSDADVRAVVLRNRGRLLFSPSRNLVVLRGTECDPEAFAAVAYLDAGRTQLLRQLQIPSLAGYASRAATRKVAG